MRLSANLVNPTKHQGLPASKKDDLNKNPRTACLISHSRRSSLSVSSSGGGSEKACPSTPPSSETKEEVDSDTRTITSEPERLVVGVASPKVRSRDDLYVESVEIWRAMNRMMDRIHVNKMLNDHKSLYKIRTSKTTEGVEDCDQFSKTWSERHC